MKSPVPFQSPPTAESLATPFAEEALLGSEVCFRSKYITDELVRIFSEETDSEEEEFEGFGWEGSPQFNCWIKNVSDSEEDTGFCSEGESKSPIRHRTPGLCVAFRFPSKKRSIRRKRASPDSNAQNSRGARTESKHAEAAPKARMRGRRKCHAQLDDAVVPGDEHKDSEVQSKRARNIEENKAMLAKLFADLSSVAELSPIKTPTKKKRVFRKKHPSEEVSERRNPSRRARPPEHFGVEEVSVSTVRSTSFQRLDIKRLLEVKGERGQDRPHGAKRRHGDSRAVRGVDDITEEELENVALAAKDKILDKDNGTTCHQCRQKTLDTKTVCRSTSCWGVKGQFCGPCLRNRYGEDVRVALLDPGWTCPLCRGICNCSLCRKREGRCATGALVHMAKFYGHGNVREYLDSLQKQLS